MCCNHYVHQQPVETTREHRAQNHDRTTPAKSSIHKLAMRGRLHRGSAHESWPQASSLVIGLFG
jgi:hypothetical protein